jgi:hypothetical protein
VLRALARHLPEQLAGLVEHRRFDAGRASLARFADAAHVEEAVAAMSPEEAAWLAELLLGRWREIGVVRLDPEVAILAPSEVWIGAEPLRVPVELLVVGVEPGWEVVWEGVASSDGGRAILVAEPEAAKVTCRAHVRARDASGRVALGAVARIAVRRPSVIVHEDRRRFVVVDQAGAPAVDVVLRIGDAEHRTGPGGLVELAQPAARGVPLRVQGFAAGRVSE